MRFLKTTCIVIFLGLFGTTQGAPVSAQIAYQGILTDASGNPLKDSAWSLTFSLHTDSTGSALSIWTEDKNISTKGGMFSHMLGSVTSLAALKFDKQYWLSVKRGGDEIGQRVKLGVVPYAMRAVVADSARKASYSDTAKIAYESYQADKSINSDTAKYSLYSESAAYADSAERVNLHHISNRNITSKRISWLTDGTSCQFIFTSRFIGRIILTTSHGWNVNRISNVEYIVSFEPEKTYFELHSVNGYIGSNRSSRIYYDEVANVFTLQLNNPSLTGTANYNLTFIGYGLIPEHSFSSSPPSGEIPNSPQYYYDYASGNTGFGTNEPKSKLSISDGDIELITPSRAIILTSPNGTKWRVTINNEGAIVSNLTD